uniref:Flagellar protein FlaG protein n=1 Tax=uncultured bacterium contig00034 TaxID=1181523 RepID=A0A806KKI1_9BACT|nr:flagellar protein FlaG protein [uncultured bacterium contig00034]
MDVNFQASAYEPIAQPAPAQTVTAAAEPVERSVSAQPERMNDQVAQHVKAQEKDRKEQAVNMDSLEKAIEQINKSISSYSRAMEISVHEKTQRIMVKVLDTEENKVIRELPPEKVLDAFARTLELAGILIDKKS